MWLVSKGAQSCPPLCDRMDCSPPGSSVHGIFQARILEWIAISVSRESSQPRSPALQEDSLPSEPQGKPHQRRIVATRTFKIMCVPTVMGLGVFLFDSAVLQSERSLSDHITLYHIPHRPPHPAPHLPSPAPSHFMMLFIKESTLKLLAVFSVWNPV